MSHVSRRHLLVSGATGLFAAASHDSEVIVGSGKLEAAAVSFDATPPLGVPAGTHGDVPVIQKIEGLIDARALALRQGNLTVGWSNSDNAAFDKMRARLSQHLKTPVERTIHSCTHNHSSFHDKVLEQEDTPFAKSYFSKVDQSAQALAAGFREVRCSWGVRQERTITYNRKGRRPDGSTFFMREEDRVEQPPDYVGVIDDRATVVRLDDPRGRPLALITHFTGHPVASYNLEEAVINPDYCGYGLGDVTAQFGSPAPVGFFLQGCAGDISCKHMFGGDAKARELGSRLGLTLRAAAGDARPVSSPRLTFTDGTAHVPFAALPSLDQLRKDKEELESFVRRCESGSPDTLRVLGYNFSRTMRQNYRKRLAEPLLRWTHWAIEQRSKGIDRPRQTLPVYVQVVTLGDVAFVLMPMELFVGIGLEIRKRSPFPCTVPVAYTNKVYPNYLGRAEDIGDREYMSAFYRYSLLPPYAKPAGDVIVDKAVDLLNRSKAAVA